MARRVECTHCGAPHRVVSGQTRFTCDYCRGLVDLPSRPGVEELIVPVVVDPDRARRAVLRWLAGRGLGRARVQPASPTHLPFWQVVSRGGEEHVLCAAAEGGALRQAVKLPAVPLLPIDHPELGSRPSLPPPAVDAEHAVSAARATFRDPEATVEILRLIWLPAVPFELTIEGHRREGLYLASAEKVHCEPLPEGLGGGPVERGRLGAYAAFVLFCLLLGLAVPAPGPRALLLGGALAAALLLWRTLPVLRPSGGRA